MIRQKKTFQEVYGTLANEVKTEFELEMHIDSTVKSIIRQL